MAQLKINKQSNMSESMVVFVAFKFERDGTQPLFQVERMRDSMSPVTLATKLPRWLENLESREEDVPVITGGSDEWKTQYLSSAE